MVSLSRSAILLLLLTAATAQQSRYIATATLPAQDVVDVVSVAQCVQREGLAATIRAEPVPPLFPALVAGAQKLLRRAGIIDLHNWILPPQCTAAAALILAVIPIFLTAERIAGRGPAVVAAIFFIALPSLARLGGDGLGDAVNLCLVAWSAWFLVRASGEIDSRARLGGRVTWGCAGLGIAAALLVRTEAIVVPLAMLLLAWPKRVFRRPSFFLAAALCIVPYLASGVELLDELIARLRGGAAATESLPLNASDEFVVPMIDCDVSLYSLGRKDYSRSSRFQGLTATTAEFIQELLQAGGYVLPLLALVGFRTRRRRGFDDYDMLLIVVLSLQLAITFAVAWRSGYLSTRHFAIPVVLSLPYAALGLFALSRQVAERTRGRFPISDWKYQTAFVVGFVVISWAATQRPLHDSNVAHRRAAEWLRVLARTGAVLDQQGFTALASGRTTYRFDAAVQAWADPELKFVVLERGDLEAVSPRGRLLRRELGTASQASFTFAAPRNNHRLDVLVFERSDFIRVISKRVTAVAQ